LFEKKNLIFQLLHLDIIIKKNESFYSNNFI